jgi:thioredoxin reductase
MNLIPVTMRAMVDRADFWQCVVVGGGAAGLSAALVLGRARRRVLVIDAGEQSNLPTHGIGGLLGNDRLAPAELYERARAELAAYPSVELRDAAVVSGARHDGAFVLSTADGTAIRAARVLLATGMEYAVPELPGVAELWGESVFHCPYCHGWEVRDGRLAVLGAMAAAHRALLLRGWSEDVVLLTDWPSDLAADEQAALERAGVPIDERPVAAIRGRDGALQEVVFADGATLPRDGLLVAAPLQQRSALAAELGAELTDRGTVDVDFVGQTTVPGLYAAGDISAMPQVAGAIADGSRAAGAINDSLIAEQYGVEPMIAPRAAVTRVR